MTRKAKTRRIFLTERDHQLLILLSRGPLTIEQIAWSNVRFVNPFPSYESLRARLSELRASGFLQSWNYYIPEARGHNYYKLTSAAFDEFFPWHGRPSKSFFREIGLGGQRHTFAVHQFIARLDHDAFQTGYTLVNYQPDHQVKLELGDRSAFPDSSFELHGHGQQLKYFLEVDCGTEVQRTNNRVRESLQKKIEFYDDYSRTTGRFRVLWIFANSPNRCSNFLDLARDAIKPPYNRTLFLAANLPTPNNSRNLVVDREFENHRGEPCSLGIVAESSAAQKESKIMEPRLMVC